MCLAHSAGLDPTCESLAGMQDQAPAIGRYVRELMTNGFTGPESTKMEDINPVEMYISLIQQLLSSAGGSYESLLVLFILNLLYLKVHVVKILK